MMIIVKRTLVALAILSLLVTVAACGQPAGTAATTTATTAAATTTGAATAVATTAAATTTANTAGSAADTTTGATSAADTAATAAAGAAQPGENTLPIANGDVDIVIYAPISAFRSTEIGSYDNHLMLPYVKEQTGLNLSFIHPPVENAENFFSTLIASGDYPDLFRANFRTYPGGPEGAIDDGVLMDINDLVQQYAPNFMAAVNELGDYGPRSLYGPSGKIIRFGSRINGEYLEGRVPVGPLLRKDLLAKAGLEAPVTIDEWTTALRAFKDMGVEVPLALKPFEDGSFVNYSPFASAYGVTVADFIQKDGVVSYSRTEPAYRDFIALMNGWMSEGLIDRDFINRTAADTEKMFYNGRAGAVVMHLVSVLTALDVGPMENPDYDVVGSPAPRLNREDTIHLVYPLTSLSGDAWFVSSSCEHPVEAVRLVDYTYMPESIKFGAWGPGDETYPTYDVDANGNRTFSTFMTENPKYDYDRARDVYTLDIFAGAFDSEMESQQYASPQHGQIWEANNWQADNAWRMPVNLSLTAEEATEYNALMNTINTYASEMMYKFVLGEEPLDNFDAFVAQLKNLGSERATAIQQQALDRYLAY